jgi:membrane protease YdiL (CAAX protease family)
MGTSRSEPALPAGLGLVAFALGLAGLTAASLAAVPLGLRAGLMAGEIGLVMPGLALAAARMDLVDALGIRPLPLRALVTSMLAGAALWVFSLGLMNLQVLVWPPREEFLETFRRLHEGLRPTGTWDTALSVIAIALLPGVCEELLFRGLVLPSFVRTAGPALAVLLSAALFGILHVQLGLPPMFDRVPFAFAVGLGLGALRLRSGSLWAPVLAHATLNTLTFVVVLLTDAARGASEPGRLDLGLALFGAGGLAFLLGLAVTRPAASRESPA